MNMLVLACLQSTGTERDAFGYHLDRFVLKFYQTLVALDVVKVFQNMSVGFDVQRSIEGIAFVIVEYWVYILDVDAEIFGQVGILATDFKG